MTQLLPEPGLDGDYAVDRLDDDGSPIRREPAGAIVAGSLVWAPATATSRLDGAWWPHTRSAATEIAALVPLVSEHLGGPVRRVSLNIDAWGPDQPRRLLVDDQLVRLGWFHTLDPATVTLGRHNDDRVTLLVLPADLAPADARALLHRLSTTSHWPDSARAAVSVAWADEAEGT